MKESNKIISVFGSSAPLPGSAAYEEARSVGNLLARSGFAVATGGYEGTMMAVSQGAADAGGHVIGVASARIERYRGTGVNAWVKEVYRYESLAERLLHLVNHNVGMIVLPGGIGTLSEMALAWSLIQVGEIGPRPIALLGTMWRETLYAFIRREYVSRDHAALLQLVDSPQAAVDFVVQNHGS